MKITILGYLCDLNKYSTAERANKYKGAKIKKDETERCMLHFLGLKFNPKIHLTFHWICKSKAKDMDNIAFAKKFILDGIVLAGALSNDGWSEIDGFSDKFSIDKKNPRIEIEIKEIK